MTTTTREEALRGNKMGPSSFSSSLSSPSTASQPANQPTVGMDYRILFSIYPQNRKKVRTYRIYRENVRAGSRCSGSPGATLTRSSSILLLLFFCLFFFFFFFCCVENKVQQQQQQDGGLSAAPISRAAKNERRMSKTPSSQITTTLD